MGELLVKEKDIVVPGDELATGMDFLPDSGAYRDNDKIIATRLGVVGVNGRAIRIIPLSGKYIPKKGDTIIGKVIDVTFTGWRIDTNSAYSAMLSSKDATTRFINRGADLTQYFNFGDYIVAKIITVTSQKLIDLTMKAPGLRKLGEGRVITVNPNKVPRIIGKNGSMVSLIKEATGCTIIVGQNGIVWLSGAPEKELLAVNTIRMIEKNAHVSGLTEKVSEFLSKVN
ncbi:RNA-binding protein [Candidatus Woesearchaeota archaeon]|nr:RNA-binding protein [Candidatus Woesearchaeota archaeon]